MTAVRRLACFLPLQLSACIMAMLAVCLVWDPPARAADAHLDALDAIVKLRTKVPPEARTARFLGTEREGNGLIIDGSGLILTIGYLIMESSEAEIETADGQKVPARYIAYDHDTGFGLLRSALPLKVRPLELGSARTLKERDKVVVAGAGGKAAATGAFVVSRRDFAGYWEYLMEDAIFTAPAYPNFGGAALLDRSGKLVGVGSLIVPDALKGEQPLPGNMFIPIDALKPILADLLTNGRVTGPMRPWIGIRTQEILGRLFVATVRPGTPAADAGINEGDLIVAVGEKPVTSLADFYRKMWAVGPAGSTIPLRVLQGAELHTISVKSIDRYRWLHLNPSY